MICTQCHEDRIPDFITDRTVCRRCAPPEPKGPLPLRPTPYSVADLRNMQRYRDRRDLARGRAAEAMW